MSAVPAACMRRLTTMKILPVCYVKWIESPFERNESQLFTYGIENPAVLFRKKFRLNKAVRKARLYATCYGVYRVEINGKRPDEREFAPEFTRMIKCSTIRPTMSPIA